MPQANPKRSAALTVMRIVSALELLSLAVIVTNRLTVHLPVVTSTGGPVHGLLYVSTILLALFLPFPRASKWLAAIPAIGGLLALWWAGRKQATADGMDERVTPHHVTVTAAQQKSGVVVANRVTATLSAATRVGPLSFAVPRGSITGVVGPNGAGKTTALRLVCGLVSPTSGSVTVGAEDGRPGSVPRVGVLIDSPGLLPSLTARENLLVLTRLAGWAPSAADRALARVGMTYAADSRVSTFSLGMRQRLGLAAALLGDPEVVILDEPTNGLDPLGKRELRDFLRTLRTSGTTVVLASHALEEVEELCDHLIAMDHGRVVFHGAPAEMLATIPETILCRTEKPSGLSAAAAAFVGAGYGVEYGPDAVRVWAGIADGGTLNRLASDAGATLSEISPTRPTLEQAFLGLTARSVGDGPPRDLADVAGVSA